MKKLISLIGAGAMLLSVATPAFGAWNWANVRNVTVVGAETGGNTVGNWANANNGSNATGSGNNNVTTGNATASNLGVIVANTNVGCCPEPCDPRPDPCDLCQGSSCTLNEAIVENGTMVGADTGDNTVGNAAVANNGSNATGSGNNNVTTGDADAGNIGIVIVNSQVSWGWW